MLLVSLSGLDFLRVEFLAHEKFHKIKYKKRARNERKKKSRNVVDYLLPVLLTRGSHSLLVLLTSGSYCLFFKSIM